MALFVRNNFHILLSNQKLSTEKAISINNRSQLVTSLFTPLGPACTLSALQEELLILLEDKKCEAISKCKSAHSEQDLENIELILDT